MKTEMAIDAIDVEFKIICSHCDGYCNEYGLCPSESCRTLTSLGYTEDETLHKMIDNEGWSDAVMERMGRNIRNTNRIY